MADSDLEALRSTLLAIPAAEVEAPDMPVATLLQECADLAMYIQHASVREKLAAVGLASSDVEALSMAEGALRTAQSQWMVSRDRTKTDAQRAREQRGEELKRELVAATRWNLRDNRKAQAVLGAIQEGEGVADTVQDLEDTAQLILDNTASFAADSTFDPVANAEAARSLAAEIRAGLSADRLPGDQPQLKELRDRAFTLLADVSSRVREAGRYAFRREPAAAARFVSAYKRRQRRRAAVIPPAAPVK